MKSAQPSPNPAGFTMIEMLVVIAIIGLLAAMLLPALSGGNLRARRVICETQLQQIGIGFQSFSHDHNSRFPAQVATNEGGALEFVRQGSLQPANDFDRRIFQTLAAALSDPGILVCPADTRLAAANFNTLQNSNLSYFAGVTASYDQPMSILAGDGNLVPGSPLLHAAAGARLTWNHLQHHYKGNVLFSDGHVEEWKDGAATLASASDLVLPDGGGGGMAGSSGAGGGGGASGGSLAGAGSSPAPAISPGNPTANQIPAGPVTAAPGNPASNPPPSPPRVALQSAMDAASRRNPDAAGAQTAAPIASASADLPTAPNPAAAAAANAADDTVMSPFNRKVARIVRYVFGSSYLLILLLLLAYAARRLRRWAQERERKPAGRDAA